MVNPFKLKMIICKLLTFWIIPSKNRKLIREFLFWFSLEDYRRFKNLNYHIVSLGSSCLSIALVVAAGLKPWRFYGEKSCPFDLYFSTDIKRTIHLIENDFSDFFKDILKSKRGTKPFKLILLTNKRVDVDNVIQIPYDIQIDDSRAIEFIINRYKNYNNEYTAFCDYMKDKLKNIIMP